MICYFLKKGEIMIKYRVCLAEEERLQLENISSKGNHKSQKVLNALILLSCDEGEFQKGRSKNEEIARVLNVSMKKIDRVKRRFVEDGFEVAVDGHKSERIYDKRIDGDFEAHLIAISCGKPPKGHCRWSLRLLADKVVELEYIDRVSHETIRQVLKKTKSNLGKRKDG